MAIVTASYSWRLAAGGFEDPGGAVNTAPSPDLVPGPFPWASNHHQSTGLALFMTLTRTLTHRTARCSIPLCSIVALSQPPP
mmetsp:Transcript_106680/g.184003  ORF Transcript_106680/g.184003 Transcript_106680/m.184003 type:complete len:82 (-) Transcript_106680:922-1167(-)